LPVFVEIPGGAASSNGRLVLAGPRLSWRGRATVGRWLAIRCLAIVVVVPAFISGAARVLAGGASAGAFPELVGNKQD